MFLWQLVLYIPKPPKQPSIQKGPQWKVECIVRYVYPSLRLSYNYEMASKFKLLSVAWIFFFHIEITPSNVCHRINIAFVLQPLSHVKNLSRQSEAEGCKLMRSLSWCWCFMGKNGYVNTEYVKPFSATVKLCGVAVASACPVIRAVFEFKWPALLDVLVCFLSSGPAWTRCSRSGSACPVRRPHRLEPWGTSWALRTASPRWCRVMWLIWQMAMATLRCTTASPTPTSVWSRSCWMLVWYSVAFLHIWTSAWVVLVANSIYDNQVSNFTKFATCLAVVALGNEAQSNMNTYCSGD